MSLGGKSQSTTDTRLEGISVNQSSYGNAWPLVYGKTRVPITLLDYPNFTATPHTTKQSGGKGGGGGSSNTTFTYSAALVMGLTKGPISAIGQVWQDKVISTVAGLGFTLFNGASGQAVWSFLTTNFPTHAVPYDRRAYLAIPKMDLGSSAAIPNITAELTGFVPFNLGTIDDAEPSAILVHYCTDPNDGANFNNLNTAQIQGAGVLTYQSYCIAMGFLLSYYEATQRSAIDFIKEMLRVTNSDAWTSAGQLNILPYADTSVTGNGRTYTPNLTPLFAFTDDDLRPPGSAAAAGADPIIIDRKPLDQTYNVVLVEYLDRSNAYNTAIARATDAQDILVNGMRTMATLTFHQITSGAVAQMVAQLILQRQLYIRRQFTFSVRADYCLLEPMDLVSITDTGMGIINKLVRLIEVDDDQNDNLTMIAEDMLVGSASAPAYSFQAAQGLAANYNITPPSVGTPLIFSAPPALVSAAGGYEMWIAVDQGAAGSWLGCDVYMSLDGTSYVYAGTVIGGARYGTLTANLASHADPDTANTLAVALTNAATTPLQLVTGSAADYNNLRTLIYVDGEIMAYQTATLTSAGHYNLTTLRRGQYGSQPGLHLSGAQFARIDAALFRVPYDPGMIGQTMHFKFCSFNLYGKNTQSLGSVTDYTHVLAATNAGQLTPGPLTLVGRGVTVNGNSVFKSAAPSAWDSDVYSVQGYTNGAFVSWQPSQTTQNLIVGLSTNPTLDSSNTSINYGLEADSAANLDWNELTNSGSLSTAYAVGDLLSVAYDGAFVRYLKNGTLLRQVPAPPNLTLYLDSSFFGSGAAAANLQFGPYGTATPVLYIPRGFAQVADENVTKSGGVASTVDSDVYSINGYATCHLVCKPNTLLGQTFVGLVQAIPASPGSAQDFSLYLNAGTLILREAGTNVLTVGAYAISDLLAITYDGSTITYSRNSVSLRTVSISGKTYFANIGLADNSPVALNSLEFGPGALISLIDTSKINTNAATDLVQSAPADGNIPWANISSGVTFFNTSDIATVSYTNNTNAAIQAVVEYKGLFNVSAAELSGIGRFAYLSVSGAASYSEDTVGYSFSPTVSPTWQTRAGSYAVASIAPGATLTAKVEITLRAAAGTYTGGPNSDWKDVVISIQAIKK